MHSLRRARSLAVALAEAASSPYQTSRLYSAGASKRQSPASKSAAASATTGRTKTASKDAPKDNEPETVYGLASPIEVPSRRANFAAEPSREAVAANWPRPSEIPFQVKVANSVNLIGHIHMPVQSLAAPDGKFWAGTVITQDQPPDSPSLWIPIIFEGDLAHIAVSHLKENDHVCIEGQLSADSPFSSNPGQSSVQVIVRSINFVEVPSKVKLTPPSQTYKKPVATKQDLKKNIEDSWRDLLHNPGEWSDHREAKRDGLVSKKFPDFKRKDTGDPLWLNTAPRWILSSIEGIKSGETDKPIPAKENKGHTDDEPWKDLVENPDNWWDNRTNKFKKTSPDFKHKKTGQALWLSSSPSWVLSKLPASKPSEEAAGSWTNAALRPSYKA